MRTLFKIAVALTLLGAVPRVAHAQDAPPASSMPETGVQGELERTAHTTPQEKVEYASTALSEIHDALREVTKLTETARKANEVGRLECLNTRLTSLRALQEVTETAQATMQSALQAGEIERADHELRKIAVARLKTRDLLAEAQQCVAPPEAMQSGQTKVVVEGGVPPTDDSLEQVPTDPFDLGMDPPNQSPFL